MLSSIKDDSITSLMETDEKDNRRLLNAIEAALRKLTSSQKIVSTLLRDFLIKQQALVSFTTLTNYQVEGAPMYLLSTEFCELIFND